MNLNLTLSDHVIFTTCEGLDGVLMNIEARAYHKLNETGTLVWRALEEGRSREEIIRELTTCYEVTPEEAGADLEQMLSNLEAHGLLQRAG